MSVKNANKTLDEFANRCKEKAGQCNFEPSELDECVVELVIASTPLDSFRHSLLQQPSGYKIEALLEEGRRHEAVDFQEAVYENNHNSVKQSEHYKLP